MMSDILNVLSLLFKYAFILIIYFFIYNIVRLIYLDIRNYGVLADNKVYIRLMSEYVNHGVPAKMIHPIGKGISVGRGRDNSVVIQDPFISKNHYRIYQVGSDYFLEDVGSSNGTLLNHEPIKKRMLLKNGDLITTGKIEFVFVDAEVSDAKS